VDPSSPNEAIKHAFERIHREWGELEKRRISENSSAAPRYSVFQLLGLQGSEIGLHSPLLCDLLNPYGSHGQGALFLRSFLAVLAKRRPPLAKIFARIGDLPDPDDWVVLPERQRVDIVIRNRREGLLIFIENKIAAKEQTDQLRRYRRLLEQESHMYSTRLLIFLSPKKYGRPRTSDPGDPYIHLNYEHDIFPWLRAIEPNIKAVHLRGVIEQYCRVIRNMDGEDAMVVGGENQDLIKLLSQQENILCALEISDSIEDVKSALRVSFWKQIDANLRNGLAESGLATSWQIEGLDDLRSNLKANWQGVYFTPAEKTTNDQAQLRLGIWQENPGWKLFYGVGFSKRPQPDPHPFGRNK
jgi:PD-(D/E)XK nuclease superfamily